jgi:hypothetical protein
MADDPNEINTDDVSRPVYRRKREFRSGREIICFDFFLKKGPAQLILNRDRGEINGPDPFLGHEPLENTKEPYNTFLSLQTRFVYFLGSF